jgi:hypothetical protein
MVVSSAVQGPDSRNELLDMAFVLCVFGGPVLLGVVFGAIQLTNSDASTHLVVMIITAGHVLQAFQLIEFSFQSNGWHVWPPFRELPV